MLPKRVTPGWQHFNSSWNCSSAQECGIIVSKSKILNVFFSANLRHSSSRQLLLIFNRAEQYTWRNQTMFCMHMTNGIFFSQIFTVIEIYFDLQNRKKQYIDNHGSNGLKRGRAVSTIKEEASVWQVLIKLSLSYHIYIWFYWYYYITDRIVFILSSQIQFWIQIKHETDDIEMRISRRHWKANMGELERNLITV